MSHYECDELVSMVNTYGMMVDRGKIQPEPRLTLFQRLLISLDTFIPIRRLYSKDNNDSFWE